MCAIAREMDRKNNTMSYSPRKWRQKNEKHDFLQRLSNLVSVATVAGNRLGNLKMRAIAHKMYRKNNTVSNSPKKWRQKSMKNASFAMPLKPCICGYGSLKSSRDLENARYSP
jgi:hypothetical protein